jgi:hypothetical protein
MQTPDCLYCLRNPRQNARHQFAFQMKQGVGSLFYMLFYLTVH